MQSLREEGKVSVGPAGDQPVPGIHQVQAEALKLPSQTCSRSAADGGWRAELGVLPVLSGMSEKTKSRAFREFWLLCALDLIRREETRYPYTSPGTWEFQKELRALSMAHRVHELSPRTATGAPRLPNQKHLRFICPQLNYVSGRAERQPSPTAREVWWGPLASRTPASPLPLHFSWPHLGFPGSAGWW